MKKNLFKKIFGKKIPEKTKIYDCGHELEKYSCTVWDNSIHEKRESLLCKKCLEEEVGKGNFVVL